MLTTQAQNSQSSLRRAPPQLRLYNHPTPPHFTGKERDTESGNDYFGSRYYASAMGRFLSPDPSQLYFADPSNPQSFNLYSYAVNNPLKFVDPSGLWHCVWDSNTGDQDDKPENGGATEHECSDQGGVWEIDQGDDPGTPVATYQVDSNHPDAGSIGGAVCAALPSAGVQGVSGGRVAPIPHLLFLPNI
jgi:RHS repeat-associated protein